MKALLLIGCIIFVLVPWAGAGTLRQKYIGQSGCSREFESSIGRYGIRLDRSQRAFLEAHTFKNKTLLLIVQCSTDEDKCGIVRDVVKSREEDKSFIFDCIEKSNPSAVVIGTWSESHKAASGAAVEAWKINLDELRFTRVNVPVVCKAGDYAGNDEGGDLASWAKERSAHK